MGGSTPLKNDEGMGAELTDKYGRKLDYLRLSVTDRCNLRCYYCMPEEGMRFAKNTQLLSFEEMLTLSALFCKMGVRKIRITGGEPFVRTGIMDFLKELRAIPELKEITVTSNATLLHDKIDELKKLGIRKINISLDSLDRQRFFEMTRRDRFDEVFGTVMRLLQEGFEVKLNCVVSAGKNTEDILPFIALTKMHPLAVRFLEEMPFNGTDDTDRPNWNHTDILRRIAVGYPHLQALHNEPNSTSVNYHIPGYKGTFGIIPSFSRTFCGSCNRIRLSATGELRTCLYGAPAANLRDELRNPQRQAPIQDTILSAIANRQKDGFAASADNHVSLHESMSVLGG